jgi:hypothetical protein
MIITSIIFWGYIAWALWRCLAKNRKITFQEYHENLNIMFWLILIAIAQWCLLIYKG